MKNSDLIGIFSNKNNIFSLFAQLKNVFKMNLNTIRIYEISENDYEYFITIQVSNKEKYLEKIENSTVIHVKNNCFFSINALNKLIINECGYVNKDYKVDFKKYKDCLIMLTNGELAITKINKIEDKCSIIFN